MNPQLLRVTNRIIERSRETRSAYLARMRQERKRRLFIVRSWHAVTWHTVSLPASQKTKPL